MISFFKEGVDVEFNEGAVSAWLVTIIDSEKKKVGDINFIFCNDDYLLEINKNYLNHDTYTDIISFDNSVGNELHGDIFISTERVVDNAAIYKVSESEELRRVMAHGLLHFCGYKDKTLEESELMRSKENEKLQMFHVEH